MTKLDVATQILDIISTPGYSREWNIQVIKKHLEEAYQAGRESKVLDEEKVLRLLEVMFIGMPLGDNINFGDRTMDNIQLEKTSKQLCQSTDLWREE